MTAECGPNFINRIVCPNAQGISLSRVNPKVFENITERWKPELTLAATIISVEMVTQALTVSYAKVYSCLHYWNTDCVA